MPSEDANLAQLNMARKGAGGASVPGMKTPDTSNISSIEFAIVLLPCLVKDFLLDWIIAGGLELTGILAILGIGISEFANVIIICILGLWCLLRLKKFPSFRFAITGVIEIAFPALGDKIPTWTAFILILWVMHILQGFSSKTTKKVQNVVQSNEEEAEEKENGNEAPALI